MKPLIAALGVCIGLAGLPAAAIAEGDMPDRFENNPQDRWVYVADTVMGGVSTGQVAFLDENGTRFARLSGRVSTENNGGFIQFRKMLAGAPPPGATGIRLIARGNGEVYFVHLRTTGMVVPWQYYQGAFQTSEGWAELRIPFDAFQPSGKMLRREPRPASIRSVGIVAYGRDHAARVDLREIGFY